MNIARIAYTNTEPFFHYWNNPEFPLVSGVPRSLGLAARDGDILAGPLPVVDCWNLERTFTTLGPWGIAAEKKCRSVFVFSKRPFQDLENATIGVTRESSTSVALCSVLLKEKYGRNVQMRRGLTPEDDAWLVIGDQALEMGYSPTALSKWTHVTDLATEWWEWQNLPFVFAMWVVRKDVPPVTLGRLGKYVQLSFHRGFASISDIAETEAKRLRLQPELIEEYLRGFMYQLTPEALHSARLFREMIKESSFDLRPSRQLTEKS